MLINTFLLSVLILILKDKTAYTKILKFKG